MNEVYIVGAARTPIGSFGGAFKELSALHLGAVAAKEAVARSGVDSGQLDEVIFGNVLQAGQGQNVARQVAVAAEVPDHVPAMTVNMVCGSGLKAVALAVQSIGVGDAELVLAGGTESMSGAPFLLPAARWGYHMGGGKLVDAMLQDGLMDPFLNEHDGLIAEALGERYGISREEQDAFAADSQQKCEAARKAQTFAEEIVPVSVRGRKGEVTGVSEDEFPRAGTTVEKLARLKPVFRKEGTITAGNASGLNDGAAGLVLASGETVRTLGLTSLARVVSWAQSATRPEDFGIAPAQAVRTALDRAGLSLEDLDLIEANEAFAVQSLALGREVGWDPDRVNVNGGAIALGHPIGASGARILVTLLYELRRREEKYGLAALCIGGGMGIAMVVASDYRRKE